MNLGQVGDRESEIVAKIDGLLKKTSNLFDRQKEFFVADINSYENTEKITAKLIQGLNFNTDAMFTSHPLFSQPCGVCLSEMFKSFNEIHKKISEILPVIHKSLTQLQSTKQQFDRNIEINMDILKKSLQIYHEQTANNNKLKTKPERNFDIINSQCTDVGVKQSQNYFRVVNEIYKVEDSVIKELEEEQKCLEKMIKNEDAFIIIPAKRICECLPFMEAPVVKREIDFTNTVPYYKYLIQEAFLDLKCNFVQQRMIPRESASRTWVTEDKMLPFYARVWEDNESKNEEELHVYKKETVKVVQAGYSDYWIVQNRSNKSGYVPSNILEPISS